MTGTGTGRGGPAGPAGREGETGVLVLFLHLGRSLKKQKLLVAGILALGILQAALLKAPLLLIDEVVGKLFPEARSAHPNALTTALSSSKNAFFDFIGLGSLLPKEGLGQTAALVAFLAVLGALSVYAFRILANLATVRVVVDMRNAICEHLMHLSLRFFAKQRSGDLISTVSNDTSTIQRSFTLFLENAYIEPLMILGNAIIAGSIIPWLFWFVLLMSLLLAIPMMTFGRKVQKGSRKSLHALGRATDTMSQMFQGFRTVKAFQLEARQLEDLNKDNQHFLKRTMRMVQAKTLSQSLLYLLYMLGFAAILIGIQ
ncbi:MAG TPA: ABC transporter transmembrane domain-containing protein, partial [Planctomycetota bacterium]|nr:ABC transporter transmembrane domain-containing protein [Planctomycetota bacterium]